MTADKFFRTVLDQPDARTLALVLAMHLTLLRPVHPTAIVATDEDVYWASQHEEGLGIHSLAMTQSYGGHPVTCVSLPLGGLLREASEITAAEWDQERQEVQWTIGGRLLAYDYTKSEKRPGANHAWRVEPVSPSPLPGLSATFAG